MSTSECIQFGQLDSTGLVAIFVGFTAIALFNSIELLFKAFITFKRYTGCYFYSVIATAIGVIFYQTFGVVNNFVTADLHVVLTGIHAGWISMVTGQSLVLWSRLHLILLNPQKLRPILGMIIFNGVALFLAMAVVSHLVSFPKLLIIKYRR